MAVFKRINFWFKLKVWFLGEALQRWADDALIEFFINLDDSLEDYDEDNECSCGGDCWNGKDCD